jgi:hypothetical protein
MGFAKGERELINHSYIGLRESQERVKKALKRNEGEEEGGTD